MTKRTGAEERLSRPSSCVGCGEAAAGYNYDAPSCFSCKAFFRRTVVSKKDGFSGCLKSGQCATDEKVKQCRACRFENCIKGGMKASLINKSNAQTENAHAPSVAEPRCSTSIGDSSPSELAIKGESKSSSRSSGVEETLATTELSLIRNPQRFECKVQLIIEKLLAIEDAHQMLRMSSYTPMITHFVSMDDIVSGPSKLGNHFEVMCPQPAMPFPSQFMPVELIIKNRKLQQLSDFDYSNKKLWFFHDLVYSVEYIKALSIYNLLDSRSKETLLSSALTCSNFTAAFYSYSHRSDRTFYPDGCTVTWDGKHVIQERRSARFDTPPLVNAMREADLNAHEYTLLKMIVVCNPAIDDLSPAGATLLSLERERCTKALLSYVLARRGVNEGPAFFTKILSIANVAMQLTTWEKAR